MFTVYVLRCSDGSLYIGQTADLTRRLKAHTAGRVSWTASRLPVTVVHVEEYVSREEAVRREKELKSGFGRKWLKKRLQQ